MPSAIDTRVVAILGLPGAGKTTLAGKIWRAMPGYHLAFDPTHSLPGAAHLDGAKARDAFLSRPGAPWATDDWPRFVADANSLIGAYGRAAPVSLLVDELLLTDGTRHRLDDDFKVWLSQRRHLRLNLVWCVQDPRLQHYALLALASEIVVFRVTDREALARLSTIGMPKDQLDRVAAQVRGEYVTYRPGDWARPKIADTAGVSQPEKPKPAG